ncbi:MAG: hypothetical protein M3209_01730 [Acidobacteriota bacterium]|nr:hypothetical protein [Acidobacteriota bacterium]
MLKKIFLLGLFMLSSAMLSVAQIETTVSFDEAALPRSADRIEKFVPSGWTVEETITGDLNNDALPDAAVKLIEKMPVNADKDDPPSRNRVLLILLKNKEGTFERATAAKKLLQCTRCGGAFYGVVEAPANVEIKKGILIVRQDSGSRNVVETTFRFRYDPSVKRFALIGYDEIDRDRATGETRSESTNYLTGVKITEIFQYNQKLDKDVKKQRRQSKVAKTPQYLEEIDNESFGSN